MSCRTEIYQNLLVYVFLFNLILNKIRQIFERNDFEVYY